MIYKYGNKQVKAENIEEACLKLGVSKAELKKNGRIVRYKTKFQNRDYEDKNLKNRLKEGEFDRNWQQKDVIRQLKVNGCSMCGYNECDRALCFHHVEPMEKKFEIRVGRIRFKDLQEEVAKTICVCLNCHAEIHEKMEEAYDEEIN